MKLRIKGNSIRLRLTQGEVDRLASAGAVEERVEFGTGKAFLTYSVAVSADAAEISANYNDNKITVTLPKSAADVWTNSDEVGLEAETAGLKVAVEKDFACLKTRAGEDESDMFPNPDAPTCS